MNDGARIDGANPPLNRRQFRRINQIGLVEEDDVGKGDLVLGLGRVVQPEQEMLGIGDSHHRIKLRPARQSPHP